MRTLVVITACFLVGCGSEPADPLTKEERQALDGLVQARRIVKNDAKARAEMSRLSNELTEIMRAYLSTPESEEIRLDDPNRIHHFNATGMLEALDKEWKRRQTNDRAKADAWLVSITKGRDVMGLVEIIYGPGAVDTAIGDELPEPDWEKARQD